MNEERLKEFVGSLPSEVLNQFAVFTHIEDTLRILQSSAECTRVDIMNALKAETEKRNK